MLEKDVATYLQLNVGGLLLGTNLFYGQMPDLLTQDNVVCVMPPLGIPTIWSSVSQAELTILVRNRTYSDGDSLVRSIYFLLHNSEGFSGASSVVKFVRALRLPVYMGRDDRGRHVWSLEFSMPVKSL